MASSLSQSASKIIDSRRGSRHRGTKRQGARAVMLAAAVMGLWPAGRGATALAQTLYWDASGATPGAGGATPTGTWGVNNFWSTDPAGAASTGAWVPDSTAVFAAGTDATGAYTVTVSGPQATTGINFEEGNVTVASGTLNLDGAAAVNVATSANATINSTLTGTGGLTKSGFGTLNLGGTNNFAGSTNVTLSQGLTAISNGAALTGSSNGINVTAGAALELTNNITVADNITINGEYNRAVKLNGTLGVVGPGNAATAEVYFPTGSIGAITGLSGNNTISGNVTLAGAVGHQNFGDAAFNTIGVAANSTLTMSGVISGSGFGKFGPGTLVLSGASPNTFTNLVRIDAGTVILAKDGALGAIQSGFDTLIGFNSSYNTVAFQGGINYATNELLLIQTSYGMPGKGVIDNFGGDNTFAGIIQLGATSAGANVFTPNTIGVSSGSLTLTNQIQGSSTGALRLFEKLGPGTLYAEGDSSFSGFINVSQGSLVLKNNSPTTGGTFLPRVAAASATHVRVKPGALFIIDQSAGVNTNRLTVAGSTVNLYGGGELAIVGNGSTASTNSTTGTIVGAGTLTVSTPGAATVLDATHYPRNDRQTLFVRGMNDSATTTETLLDNTTYTLSGSGGAAGTSSVSIIPAAVGNASAAGSPTDFVTYGTAAANSVRVLAPGEYGALVSGDPGTPLVNAAVSSSPAPLGATTTINSLKLGGASTALNLGGQTLNVQSGAILATGDTESISNGTLHFGSEGIVHVANNSMTISATMTGAGGFTKAGSGSLTLSAASNTYTGDTYLNAGTLIVNADSQLGDPSSNLHIAGGALRTTTGFSTARNVVLPGISFAALSGYGGVDVPAGQTTTFTGVVSGSGSLSKTGDGTLVLANGSNTYSGGTSVTGGILSMSSNALGPNQGADGSANIITLDGGTLQFTGGSTINIDQHAFYFGYNGATVDVSGPTTLVQFNATGAGQVRGPGSFTKIGSGTFEFVSDSPNFAGGVFIKDGTVQLDVGDTFPGSAPTATVAVSGNGRLFLNSVTIPNVEVALSNGGTLSGTGNFGSSRGLLVSGTGGTIDTNASTVNFTGSALDSFAGNLQIKGGGTVNLSRSGGASTVTPGATITVNDTSTLTVLAVKDMLTDGTNFVNVVNNSTMSPSFNVEFGSQNIGAVDGTGDASVQGGGTMTATHVRQGNLLVSGGNAIIRAQANPSSPASFAGVSKLTTLNISSGTLDLTNNKLIVTGMPVGTFNGTTYSDVTGLIQSGRNGGGWGGQGIVTSQSNATSGNFTSIGVAKAGQVKGIADGATAVWAGQTVTGTDTLVMYTYGGDANLDGKINVDDYGRIDSSIPLGIAGWYNGDFNYDGKINVDDYGIIDSNIGIQGAQFATGSSAGAGSSLSGVSAVPEPASVLGVIAACGVASLKRRRRRDRTGG